MVTLSTARAHAVYLALVFASPSLAHPAPPLAHGVSAPAPQDIRAAAALAESHLQTGWDRMKSGDFEAAIAEGSTLVRIGTALFGGKIADHEEMEES